MKEESINAIVVAQEMIQEYAAQHKIEAANLPCPIPVLPAHPPQGDHEAPATALPETIANARNFELKLSRNHGIGEIIEAYFLRWKDPDRVRITYSDSLDVPSARLCICKELAHVALGNPSNFTVDAPRARDLITALINDDVFPTEPELVVEHVAYHAAMEMLMPYQLRSHMQAFQDHGADVALIAESYNVPEYLVDFRCMESTDELFNEAYKKIGLMS